MVNLITGDTKSPALNAAQIIGGGFGIAVSHGAAGGPLRGEMTLARNQHEFDVQRALPAIRKQIIGGDTAGAVIELRKLGIPPNLIRYYVRQALNPSVSSDQLRKVLEYATPEQRERMQRQIRTGAEATAR